MGEYFKTTVTGIDETDVNRRVAELIAKGFEIVAEGEESRSVAIYKRTNSVGRSKTAFAEREERGKYIVVMRRRNAVRTNVRGDCCIDGKVVIRFGPMSPFGVRS